jgi:uncharacterized protein with PQ loop repeat
MRKDSDIFFKLGLVLQLLLIPVAFLYHFSSEGSNYNIVLGICLALVVILFLWPQTIMIRAKRLKAIKLQFLLVIIALAFSWLAYGFLYHYTRTHCTPTYTIHWQGGGYSAPDFSPNDLGKNCDFNPTSSNIAPSTMTRETILPWFLLWNPGISLTTAGIITGVFLLFPSANYYRYSLDRKRIKGIKKTDLFA